MESFNSVIDKPSLFPSAFKTLVIMPGNEMFGLVLYCSGISSREYTFFVTCFLDSRLLLGNFGYLDGSSMVFGTSKVVNIGFALTVIALSGGRGRIVDGSAVMDNTGDSNFGCGDLGG